jgi:ATP-dependent protease ClpP protease subunit
MKKFIILLCVLLLNPNFIFANGPPEPIPPRATKSNTIYIPPYATTEYVDNLLKESNNETPEITRTMTVPFQEKCLSDLTYVIKDTAHMSIYSVLGLVDEKKIYDDLQILENMPGIKKIKVFMNSPGGGAYAGFAIADQLKRAAERFDISIYASGVIASAAVMVFIAVEDRYVSEDTFFMVHEVAAEPNGSMSASDVKKMNALFDMLTARYVKNLVSHSNKTEDDWQEMMKSETWFSAQEALDWGLVKAVK